MGDREPAGATIAPAGLIRQLGLATVLVGVAALLIPAVGVAKVILESMGHGRPFDLSVYRGGALAVANGRALYQFEWHRFYRFTYPPFAALIFLPLAAGSLSLDAVVATALSCGALACALWRAGVLADRGDSARLLVLLVPLMVVTGPVAYTFSFGQINLVIAAMVITDLSLPDANRQKGLLVGLAAGLVLTPLIFIAYLLLSGRRRPAMVAVAAFAATVAVGFLVVPGDASAFWLHGLFLDPHRLGGIASVTNQSLTGALLRLSSRLRGIALPVCACVAAVGLLAACRASASGEELLGFVLAALTGLLFSPVSWVHQWALVLPALPYLALRRSWARVPALAMYAATDCYWALPAYHHYSHRWLTTLEGQLLASLYLWPALLILALAAWRAAAALRGRGADDRDAGPAAPVTSPPRGQMQQA